MRVQKTLNETISRMEHLIEGMSRYPEMTMYRRLNAAHQIEVVGEKLRSMMPWIGKNKIVDKTKN